MDARIELVSNPLPTEKEIKAAVKSALEDGTVKEFKDQVAKGFDSESTPGGPKWEALSPDYEKFKKAHGGGSILQRSGDLKKAATDPQVQFAEGSGDDSGSGGSGDSNSFVYSAILTMSGDGDNPSWQEFGVPDNNLPARPFFDLEGDAETAVDEATAKAFEKELGI